MAVITTILEHEIIEGKKEVFKKEYNKKVEIDTFKTIIKLRVEFVNIDNPDDRFCVEHYGYGIDTQDKGVGKAVSYAYKYALLKTFALETGENATMTIILPNRKNHTKISPCSFRKLRKLRKLR